MLQPMKTRASVPQGLSPNVPVLGLVSLLMGMSSAMIYGVLPVFLVVVLGASTGIGWFHRGNCRGDNVVRENIFRYHERSDPPP